VVKAEEARQVAVLQMFLKYVTDGKALRISPRASAIGLFALGVLVVLSQLFFQGTLLRHITSRFPSHERPLGFLQTSSIPTTPSPKRETILVALASYRDDECVTTIFDMFGKAEFPERIFLAAVEQNMHASEACMPSYLRENLGPLASHVRLITQPHTDARSCAYPRYFCAKMHRGEDYYFQIDSHTLFVPKWDSILIDMIKRAPPGKTLLTTYPLDFNCPTYKTEFAFICTAKFDGDDIITFTGGMYNMKRHYNHFWPTAFFAGGFAFSNASVLYDVPYDPNLPFLFHGEEILRAVRLYTHGWNSYGPDLNVIYHHYIRSDKPKYWSDVVDSRALQNWSRAKVRYILGYGPQPKPSHVVDEYELLGLGKERTLEEYWSFSGLHPSRKGNNGNKLCPT